MDKQKEIMNHVIVNMDEIIAKSLESPENRKLLTEMFPHVFQLDAKFCAIGDILLRKGKDTFFTLTWVNADELGIMNLQYGKSWENRLRIDLNRRKIKDKDNRIFISKREFEMLSKHYFSDFIVLPRDLIITQYGRQ